MKVLCFGENLKELRNKHDISMDYFCQTFNEKYNTKLNKSTVSRYENGSQEPMFSTVVKIADYFSIDVEDLLYGENTPSIRKIPILGKVPAGIPIEAIEDVLGYEEIPETMAKTGEFFGLRVEGNSMYPLLYSGETIIIKKQASADNGDIVVALIDNEETTVKRLKVMPDGLVLEAENPEYNSLFFNEKQLQNGKLQIIGKAVESRKKL